jgi:glucokinase
MTDAAKAGDGFCALVGDIGGTHARLALAEFHDGKPVISDIREFPSPAYSNGRDIVRDYLSQTALKPQPQTAAIAVAGPITNGSVHFTNLGWALSENDLRELGFAKARLLNDFEALALSIRHLSPGDLHRLGAAQSGVSNATVAVIGPGTGFGASALVRNGTVAVAMAAEGGHASFAPGDDVERDVLRVIARRHSHVSIERILSGPGLLNLHAALNEIESVSADAGSPAEITGRALNGEPHCRRTVLRFCAILGSVAGDFALYYGARGGMFIAGGIAPSIVPILEMSDFRRRFEAKGRFNVYLAPIPTQIVMHAHPAFLGAAEIAWQMSA